MDILSISAQQWNLNNPFSSSPAVPLSGGGGESFEEILRGLQSTASGNAPRLPNIPPIVQNEELYELCMELETILLKTLIKGMRDTVQKSNLIDTGFAGEFYEDMLYDEYTKSFARNANFGFAEMAYRQLSDLG